MPLARAIFSSLTQNEPTGIPQYNKGAFDGQGDRVPESEWEKVNVGYGADGKIIKVVLFEGWSVGFRPLDASVLRRKWEDAVRARERGDYVGRLGHNSSKSVVDINEALREYDSITKYARRVLPFFGRVVELQG